MSLPKILVIFTLVLFSGIGFLAMFKKDKAVSSSVRGAGMPIEVEVGEEIQLVKPEEVLAVESGYVSEKEQRITQVVRSANGLPNGNRIEQLFNKEGPKLPIVETITYTSRVPWQKGRPAWLSDYASHYETSRHFVARSLNGKPDYLKQDVVEGDRFNVLRQDKKILFYLLIDLSRCKMWFYCHDGDTNERVLLKTYDVGLGRIDSSRASGLLTPTGKYTLGNKIAIYKPGIMGHRQGEKIEMIRVFGTRWIPFEKEIGQTSAPAKGFGIHGAPWVLKGDQLIEDGSSIGKYESDGCVRLASADMEELFAIIITKPAVVELVKDYVDAQLPGKEK